MGSWSMLPYDLLGLIALKADAPEDFVYFACTCRSWYQASSRVKTDWRAKAPILLLSENTNENPDCRRKIYSLSSRKCYELLIPETFGARCWGSSCGWIVIFDETRELYLFNPITKAKLSLPPQSTMPSQTDHPDDEWVRRNYIRRVFVLSVSNDPNDVVVFAFHGNGAYAMKLAFARPSDESWTIVHIPEYVQYKQRSFVNSVIDIVCHGRKVLFLYAYGSIGCCDIDDFTSTKALELVASEYMPSPRRILRRVLKDVGNNIYLIEASGDLFMILRYKEVWEEEDDAEDDKLCYVTSNFEVYRLERDAKKWTKVDHLGDVAFFVGDNNSMSFRSYGVCKSNCIYFTDDDMELRGLRGLDIGYFDMETKETENFHEGDDMMSTFCTPFWFYPEF